MDNIELIIFDCDGTLTDSEIANNQATIDIFADIGIHYTLDYALANWVGKALPGILLSVQMETGKTLPDDFLSRYPLRVAELQKNGLQPVKGALDLVAATAEKYKICVASNGERSNVLSSLEITGLMKNFTEASVFTKSQVKNPKPAPDLFLYAASQMNVEAANCVVIEDSVPGVMAGVAAGMTTWGFTGSAHDRIAQAKNLKSAGAHEIFGSLIHIRQKLIL